MNPAQDGNFSRTFLRYLIQELSFIFLIQRIIHAFTIAIFSGTLWLLTFFYSFCQDLGEQDKIDLHFFLEMI